MKGFYIIKPDMLEDNEAINYYKNFVLNNDNISFDSFYLIEDWVLLSKLLYELKDNNMSLSELKQIRSQIMTTIMGYYQYYSNIPAILSIIDIEDDSKLQELYDFKKELRRKFVYDKDKYYLRYDCEVNFEKKLIDLDCHSINASYLKLDKSVKPLNNYRLILFNELHFSDPSVDAINSDFEVLRDSGIIKPKNLIKKFIKEEV